jgi:IclR family mhp operon transcriptional activator
LREVLWPTDISTLDVDAMVVRETTHRFSRLSFHRAMVGRRLPLLLTASGSPGWPSPRIMSARR